MHLYVNFFYATSICTTIKLPLRRSVHRSVRCAAFGLILLSFSDWRMTVLHIFNHLFVLPHHHKIFNQHIAMTRYLFDYFFSHIFFIFIITLQLIKNHQFNSEHRISWPCALQFSPLGELEGAGLPVNIRNHQIQCSHRCYQVTNLATS